MFDKEKPHWKRLLNTDFFFNIDFLMVDGVGVGQGENKDYGKVKIYIGGCRGLAKLGSL